MAGPRDILVGRERELAALKSALEDALAGRGRLVMIVGEPGIGKTRVAEELADLGRQQGAEVLWGRCTEQAGAPPLWPWIQIIRAHLKGLDTATASSAPNSNVPVIAQILPEITERTGDLPMAGATVDPDAARFQLYDSVTSFMKRASESLPLVLILDDLHWADSSSVRLLEFLAPEISDARLLVVGTYRDADVTRGRPLFDALGAMSRLRMFSRIHLSGLNLQEVDGLIAATSGARSPGGLAAVVHENTEGNPLYVREVVRLLEHEGLLTEAHAVEIRRGGFQLPEGLREVIGRRMNRLSAQCNAALTVAAVIGREFSPDLLRRAIHGVTSTRSPIDPDARTDGGVRQADPLLDPLDEAIRARVIEDVAGQGNLMRFTHVLYGQALREELTPVRRRQLHADVAVAMEEQSGTGAAHGVEELAFHFAAASPIVGPEPVIRYSVLAGERGLEAFAYQDAAVHFEHALAALKRRGSREEDDNRLEARILDGLGQCQGQLGALQTARQNLLRAFELYTRTGDPASAIRVAILPFPPNAEPRYLEMIEAALGMVAPDSLDAGYVHWRTAGPATRSDDGGARAREHLRKALEIARRHGDVSLESRVKGSACGIEYQFLNYEPAIDFGLNSIRLVSTRQPDWNLVHSHFWTAIAQLALGHVREARGHADACQEAAERTKAPFRILQGLGARAMVALARGDLQMVSDLVAQMAAITAGFPTHQIFISYLRFIRLLLGTDRVDEGGSLPGESGQPPTMDQMTPEAVVVQLSAYIAELAGANTVSDQKWNALKAALAMSDSTPATRIWYAVSAGLAAALRHDAEQARVCLAALEPARGLVVLGWGWIGIPTSVDRVRARLAATLGDYDAAGQYFEAALAFCRDSGCESELAWICQDYATTLTERARSADLGKLRSVLDLGEPLAARLGMVPLAARMSAMHSKVDAVTVARPGYPDGLTQREVEVLRLVAAGKSNREIATSLVISENTVIRHVSNVFGKARLANRAEAVAYAIRNRLVGDSLERG